MKVQKCISYNLQLFKCLYLYIFYWEVVGNAARGKKKKRFKVAWRFFSRWPPVHSRLGNFTAMKVCLGIPAGEDVMLEYLCVLITQLWLFHHLHHKRVFFFFYPSAADLNLQPFKYEGGGSEVGVSRVKVLRRNHFQISNCLVKGLYNYHWNWNTIRSFPPKYYQIRPCKLPRLSLLTFLLLECGCEASSNRRTTSRFQIFPSRCFTVSTVNALVLT